MEVLRRERDNFINTKIAIQSSSAFSETVGSDWQEAFELLFIAEMSKVAI